MTPEKLLAAVEIINEAGDAFNSCPEDRPKAIEAALFLSLAGNYLSELAAHIHNGVYLYDAVLNTVRGELLLTDSQQTLTKILIPRAK